MNKVVNFIKSKKMIVGVTILLVLLVVMGTIYYLDYSDNKDKIKYIHASYGFDANNLNNIVSDADYIFVGKVINQGKTVYKYPVKVENKWITSPYTYYNLQVIKNVKGNLLKGKNVKILKAGGKDKYSNVKYVYENDILPNKNEYYIFAAYVQQDGSLLVSGVNSTIKTTKYYVNTSSYKKIYSVSSKVKSKNRKRYKLDKTKIYN